MEEVEYEESRQFQCMLDAATERIFEACSEIMGVESSDIAIACNTEAFRQGTSNLVQVQGSELRLELSPINTLPPAPQASSSSFRPRKRRKRSWTPDLPVLEQPFPSMKINIIPTAINWASMPLKVFEAKGSLTFSNNFCQDQRRGPKNHNVGSAGSSVNSFLAGPMNDGKSETEDLEKCQDFSKELHDVINKMESLIPSLQKWVSSVQKPVNQKGVGHLELQRNCSSICNEGQVNRLGMTKFQEITGNDQANSSKYAEHAKLEGIMNNSLCPDLRDLSLERNFLNGKSRVHGQTIKFSKGRVESLRRVSSRNESIGSHTSEHLQRLRIKPRQCSKNEPYQKDTSKRLRFQTPLPAVGSDLKVSKFRDTITEETSGSSLGYSSGTSTHPSSFSGSTYSSISAENEYEEVGQTSSESCTDYETASYDSHDQYSDTSSDLGPSSEEDSSERLHKWEDHHLETRKRVGMISKIGKKFGMIFHHHHHHHHHHYSGRDETGLGHVGFLKRVGKMFHRRGKSDGQRQKPEKSRKPMTKCVTKKRQDGGHFRALIDGLMKHKKHSKKTEKAKDEIGRVGSVRHKSKRGTKKFSWWPKKGKNKAKLGNKGKVKLGRAMTIRAKRSQFAAAKMILK